MTHVAPLPGAGLPSQSVNGILLMLLAVFTFATQDAISKHLGVIYSPAQILMVRFIAFFAFALWFAHRRGGIMRSFMSKRPVLQVIRCTLLVVEIGIFVYVVARIPLADLHALFAVAPLMVTALSVPLLGEPVGIRRWAAVIVGFGGVLIILRPGLGVMDPVAPLALIGAFMFALYVILTRMLSRVDRSDTSLVYLGLVGAVGCSIVGPFTWIWPDPWGWFWLITLSVTAIIGHTLFILALEAASPATLQPFQYTVLIWGAVIGYVIFGDFPDNATILGAAIVTASGLYTFYRERVRARQG